MTGIYFGLIFFIDCITMSPWLYLVLHEPLFYIEIALVWYFTSTRSLYLSLRGCPIAPPPSLWCTPLPPLPSDVPHCPPLPSDVPHCPPLPSDVPHCPPPSLWCTPLPPPSLWYAPLSPPPFHSVWCTPLPPPLPSDVPSALFCFN